MLLGGGFSVNAIHTASDVAKWFISYNHTKAALEEADDISNLKLQKLLYYAQGAMLALTGRPIFVDNIVAWEHGPVVPVVYHEYKHHGRNGIPFDDSQRTSECYTEEEENILKDVYEEFGQYSAWKLRNMTHSETPWKSTEKNDIISQAVIADYFKATYCEA